MPCARCAVSHRCILAHLWRCRCSSRFDRSQTSRFGSISSRWRSSARLSTLTCRSTAACFARTRARTRPSVGGFALAVRARSMPSVCRFTRNKRRLFAAAPLLARGVCAVHLAVRAAIYRVVRRWRAGGRVQHLPRCALATSAPRLGSPLRSPRGILRGCSHALPYFVCKCARVREPVCALTLACVQGTDGRAHCRW